MTMSDANYISSSRIKHCYSKKELYLEIVYNGSFQINKNHETCIEMFSLLLKLIMF